VKFIILGAGPGLPTLDRNQSCLYINMSERHILADCGEGTAQKLLRHGLDANVIDAILITHYHPDHISGIYMVLQMLYLQQRTKPLKLFLPERQSEFLATLSLFYTFPTRFQFILEVYPVAEVGSHIGGIIPVMNDHLLGYGDHIHRYSLKNMMQAYSLRFEEGDGSLVYTSDLATMESIRPIVLSTHSVIIDALHPNYKQISALQDMSIQRIILTHGISDELAAWLEEANDPRFEPAREDYAYYL